MIDEDTDPLFVWIVLIGGGLAGGPSLLAAAGVDVGGWLVDRQVLLPADQAVFALPLVAAGPDWPRLALSCGVVVLTAALAAWAHRLRRDRGQLGP